MNLSKRITPKLPQNAFEAILVLIAFTIPFNFLLITNIFVIILAAIWLVGPKTISNILAKKILATFLLLYFLHLISLFYTSDIATGLSILEKKLMLFALPLLLLTRKNENTKYFSLVICSFLVATLSNTFYSLIRVLLLDNKQWGNFQGYTGKDYRLAFSFFSDIHPTYFSVFIFLSIFIIIYFIFRFKNSYSIVIPGVISLLFLVFTSLLLASRTPLIIFIIIALLSSLFYFYINKRLLIGLILVIGFIACLGIIGYQTESIRYRFQELKETEYSPPKGINHTSTNIRVGLLFCSKEVLQENWIFGTGIGDAQHILNNCYKQNNYSNILYLQDYNSHNQYLQIWISLGITALLLFLYLNYMLLLHAFRNKNYLHAAFTVFIIICFLTESFLEMNKGIILFSFFHSLFIKYSHSDLASGQA